MALLRFQSNFRFAFHREAIKTRNEIPLNQCERIGNFLSWFAYEFKFFFIRTFCEPRFITVCFTSIAMILISLLFYPSTTWDILSDTYTWILDHINWSYVRFALWLLSEITIFGLGLRAFGRFSNRRLMEYHGIVS